MYIAPSLEEIVRDFAAGMKAADAKRPVAQSARSQRTYLPGLGPFSEALTVKLVMNELQQMYLERYRNCALEVSYPEQSRSKCDLCIGTAPCWDWAIEVKMLRLLGDNGLPNDNMLMHILSPYAEHHSALTDCEKLVASALMGKKAILIYGYECKQRPMECAIAAFEKLAGLDPANRFYASADGLIHPVHQHARVFAWSLS
jgi:hypothetical protein